MNLGVSEQLFEGLQFVGFFVVDFFDSRIYQDLQAMDARGMGDIDRGFFDTRTVFCCLISSLKFRLDRSEAILLDVAVGRSRLVNQATDVGTMGHAGRSPVIPGRQDVLVSNDYRADFGAEACGPFRDLTRDGHKILIPA